MGGVGLLNLDIPLRVPHLIVPRGNHLADARVDGAGQHGVAADAVVAEPPGDVLGRSDL